MPKILVFAVIGVLIWTIIGLQGDIMKATARRNELKEQAAAIELENDEMRRQINTSDEDETIAEIARDDLSLIMPGEQVYYD